jgi:hypothetical protein
MTAKKVNPNTTLCRSETQDNVSFHRIFGGMGGFSGISQTPALGFMTGVVAIISWFFDSRPYFTIQVVLRLVSDASLHMSLVHA